MRLNRHIQNPHPPGRFAWAWEHVGDDNAVLDYGCHDGKVLTSLRCDDGAIRVGVDLSGDAIGKGQKAFPDLDLRQIYPGQPLPFENDTFDRILLLDVLEHIADQQSVLFELCRVLKVDGLLVVTVPGKHLFSFLDFGNWKFYFPGIHRWYIVRRYGVEAYEQRYGHANPYGLVGDIERAISILEHFSRQSLGKVLAEAGFKVIAFDGTGYFQRFYMLCNKLLPIRRFWWKLIQIDHRLFHRANLFCTAKIR